MEKAYKPTRSRHAFHLGRSDTAYRKVTEEQNPRQLGCGKRDGQEAQGIIYNVKSESDNWVTFDGETYEPLNDKPLDVLLRQDDYDVVFVFVTVPASPSGDKCEVYDYRRGWRAMAPTLIVAQTQPLDNSIDPDAHLQNVGEIYARPLRYVKNCTPAHDRARRAAAERL